MTPEAEPHPIPDPRKLQPEGLSNRTKRWMFLGVMGIVLLIVVANMIGTPPAAPVSKPRAVSSQQQNPTSAQLDDYSRYVTEQQAALLDKTRADAANLQRLQADAGHPSLEDLQRQAALQEAARTREQFQQTSPGSQPRPAAPAEKERAAIPDSVIRQDHAQQSPVPAPWQHAAVEPALERNSPSVVSTPVSGPTAAEGRKPLDFDPSLRTYWLPEGTVMEAVLTNRLDGEAAGPVNAMITTDVYLPGTRMVLIPQGARAIGEASKVTLSGQQRLAVAFHRIIVPGLNAYSIPLDAHPPALAQAGEVGLHDKVNSHYAQIFGASLAIGAIGGLAQIGNGQTGFGFDPAVQFRNGVSQSTAQASERILDRFLNRLPSITIREGTRTKILLTNDLQLPAYSAGEI